ncbi:hypothetical protein AB0L71_28520 [Streptomyces sp. NPDC052052]|uniref:hypothetical protein n=1 Tax=Streptomyces sp. NPDC052052 TaxID=3154756 RepID=UPI00342459CC
MARTPTSPARTIRARLAAASAKLTEAGSPDLAAAVDEVLAPNGWGLLRRTEENADTNPNLAIFMNKEIRESLKAKAEAKGTTLTADVTEAFRKFVAGEFVPDAPIRSRRNSGAEKGNLNVRPDADLLQQVKDLAEQKSAEYGWTVTPARVASAYLMRKYRISEAAQAK